MTLYLLFSRDESALTPAFMVWGQAYGTAAAGYVSAALGGC